METVGYQMMSGSKSATWKSGWERCGVLKVGHAARESGYWLRSGCFCLNWCMESLSSWFREDFPSTGTAFRVLASSLGPPFSPLATPLWDWQEISHVHRFPPAPGFSLLPTRTGPGLVPFIPGWAADIAHRSRPDGASGALGSRAPPVESNEVK